MVTLRWVSMTLAIVGSLTVLAVAILTTVSVIGRAFFYTPIHGDVEISTMGIGLALSLCLPWCQYHGANILVDFFCQWAKPTSQRRLDGLGSLLIAAMYLLLAWCTMEQALVVRGYFETTMILELPLWWIYAALAPGLTLSAIIAIFQSIRQLQGKVATPSLVSHQELSNV